MLTGEGSERVASQQREQNHQEIQEERLNHQGWGWGGQMWEYEGRGLIFC